MSITITGFLIAMLTSAVPYVGSWLRAHGVDVADSDVLKYANDVVAFAGWAMVWYGRYRQGDITFYGKKKVALPIKPYFKNPANDSGTLPVHDIQP